ncbi:DUF2938 domain-containing protein [Aquabacterium sp.]|uniref:DUF2938 domain-containing protein n=1 Tax=Aquabacterium sp. TaxID=1872578 RepID=UPI00248972C5|nr:DUF2938 domain-containing protein [Aquabacterium sp.]MDI1261246.1 DUF2938 domain-containing protein [Aquabacterium sp.]
MDNLPDIFRIAFIGFGATAVMDVWLKLLKRMGVATQSFGLIGRWVGHLLRGQVAHQAISKAEPIPGELAWGWLTHYAVGAAFAALLVMAVGPAWMLSPTLPPALAVGVLTVAAPLLVMQPAMGAGFFASKTPAPLKSCIRSLLNHSIFGVGLYLAASLIALVQF